MEKELKKEFEKIKSSSARELRMGSWDSGLDFENARRKLWELIETFFTSEKKNDEKRFAYCLILYLQLYNASRISEAIRGFKIWLESGRREFYIKVSKRKDNETRFFRIPDEIRDEWRRFLSNFSEDEETLKKRVKAWASKHGLNTHALRYARITHLIEVTKNPVEVGKITGHKKLDMLLEYAQKHRAEEILRKY